MAATLHTLSPDPAGLRAALFPGSGPHVEAIVRAYLPPPHRITQGSTEGVDLGLVWWDGPASTVDRGQLRPEAPLVALCAGGPETLAAALDAGADYALALPITSALLRAVCAAHVRRPPRALPLVDPPSPRASMPPPSTGALTLDRRARTLAVHGLPVPLTLREFDLLAYLVENPGACCSRDELLERVWGIDFETGTNTVDVFIYALRRKLRANGLSGAIQTVRGVGYRLAPHLP